MYHMCFKYRYGNKKCTNSSVSTDGKEWTELRSNGEFSNIMHNPVPMTVRLQKNPEARYIKIEATNPIGAPATITVDEIGVMAVQP